MTQITSLRKSISLFMKCIFSCENLFLGLSLLLLWSRMNFQTLQIKASPEHIMCLITYSVTKQVLFISPSRSPCTFSLILFSLLSNFLLMPSDYEPLSSPLLVLIFRLNRCVVLHSSLHVSYFCLPFLPEGGQLLCSQVSSCSLVQLLIMRLPWLITDLLYMAV